MDGTILGQGMFTQGATAVAQTLIVPSNLDWLRVWNYTQANQSTAAAGPNGFLFYWQRSMPNGTGIVELSGAAGAVTVNITANNAFVLYDPSMAVIGANVALSAMTAANPAVVTTGSTAGLSAGSVVRFNSLNNQPQYTGIDFSVGYGTFNGTHFSVDYLNSTGSTASTSGNWVQIPFQPLFYPRRRIITNITAASQAVITLSVDHGFTVGQEVRLNLPGGSQVWGSFALLSNYNNTASNSVTPNSWIIVAVDTATGNGHNTITINANTTGFTGPTGGSFVATWAAQTLPYTPTEVVPIGEDTATSLAYIGAQTPLDLGGVNPIYNANNGILADSTVNTGYLGITLAAGAALPAGVASDVVYWVAGKSTFGGL